jgi:hypothetical protein
MRLEGENGKGERETASGVLEQMKKAPFVLSVLLILAWKTAGCYGLDRWLLRPLGAPWMPGFRVGTHAE